jgi:LmbE family N-acetylglucosaminyl deacetylase
MRILCIHAHPDDSELFAAGTLCHLKDKGHHVTIVTMTPGDCGSHEHDAEQIARIRRKEAADAAALIGADYFCAEFRDLAIISDDPSRRLVTSIIRRTRPDIVLTASPSDYHCDHEATSALVRDACFAAPAPNYDTSRYGEWEAIPSIPHLYFTDPAEGVDREGRPVEPHITVNIGPTFARKRDMLACHKSQRDWLLQHHGMDDYIKTMEDWARARGLEAGFEFGEGFRQYKVHPYPTIPLLEDLLGNDLVYRH